MSGTFPTVYTLDAEAQTELACLAMHDNDFLRRTDGLVKPAYFTDEIEAGFVKLSTDFYAKYREAPSNAAWIELIKAAFKTKPVLWREDIAPEVIAKFKESSKLEIRSKAFLLDKIEEFAQQQEIMNGLISSASAIGKETDPDRFQKIRDLMGKAFKVGLREGDEDYDFFERIEERTDDRLLIASGGAPKTGVTTGIKELDDILMHGGWGRGELSSFMGPAKSGKSFFLGYCAGRAVLAGFNVLYITLENSTAIAAGRLDALMSEVAMAEHTKSPHTVRGAINAIAKSGKAGVLKIRSFPTGTFKPKDMERLLEEYQIRGVDFDICVVDYLDIMQSDMPMDSNIDTSKHVYTRVRGIAGTYQGKRGRAAFLSATQTNREGAKAAVAHATQVAEDYNRIRVPDLVIGISRTEEEKKVNKARLNLVASRNQSEGPVLFLSQDLARAQAVSSVDAVE